MLNYKDHIFEGIEYTSVWSDADRYVLFNGEVYSKLWVRKEEARFCTEGDKIPTDEPTETDKAEAYDILMGGAE